MSSIFVLAQFLYFFTFSQQQQSHSELVQRDAARQRTTFTKYNTHLFIVLVTMILVIVRAQFYPFSWGSAFLAHFAYVWPRVEQNSILVRTADVDNRNYNSWVRFLDCCSSLKTKFEFWFFPQRMRKEGTRDRIALCELFEFDISQCDSSPCFSFAINVTSHLSDHFPATLEARAVTLQFFSWHPLIVKFMFYKSFKITSFS